jgi:hypothetical protein
MLSQDTSSCHSCAGNSAGRSSLLSTRVKIIEQQLSCRYQPQTGLRNSSHLCSPVQWGSPVIIRPSSYLRASKLASFIKHCIIHQAHIPAAPKTPNIPSEQSCGTAVQGC